MIYEFESLSIYPSAYTNLLYQVGVYFVHATADSRSASCIYIGTAVP